MFKSKTLFIVGAGASCEANLPSGEALKYKIAELLDIRFEYGWRQEGGDFMITEALKQHVRITGEESINSYLEAAWHIRSVVPASALSIDNFINSHRENQRIALCGKLGIVKGILDAEGESTLRSAGSGSDLFEPEELSSTWFSGFFKMLTEDVDKSEIGNIFENVTIITFNYDRCIERYLVQMLGQYYGVSIPESEKIVRKLKIIHPYGQIGNLPWQGGNSISFGAKSAPLISLVGLIRTFSEGMADEEILGEIHSEIIKAETMVFLGFAFNPSNMRLLKPNKTTQTKRVFATTWGLSSADEEQIKKDINLMLGRKIGGLDALKPALENVKCGEFFKRYFRSLSADV